MKPHKHKDMIVAWAEGHPIQYWDDISEKWEDVKGTYSTWREDMDFRIKPKENVVKYISTKLIQMADKDYIARWDIAPKPFANLKLEFNPDDGVLIKAEVIK